MTKSRNFVLKINQTHLRTLKSEESIYIQTLDIIELMLSANGGTLERGAGRVLIFEIRSERLTYCYIYRAYGLVLYNTNKRIKP